MDFEKDFEDVCSRLTDIISDELEMFGDRHNVGTPSVVVIPISSFEYGESDGKVYKGVEIDFDCGITIGKLQDD